MLHPLLSMPFSRADTVSCTLILFISLARSLLNMLCVYLCLAIPLPPPEIQSKNQYPKILLLSILHLSICIFKTLSSFPFPYFWTRAAWRLAAPHAMGRRQGIWSSPFPYCFPEDLEQNFFPLAGWDNWTDWGLS